ncbi:tetratricopeptide repeat protein [uncultured Alsobacter sp.]|uniref:tetratricopeptide repeat protein n=1 Tax=uncultured Alsobacter sp. TaxID=1748258 RepID=UPI0025E70764|nr:tetratricopeptide repeat protein [uncultured Alsobacter sp.]
MTDDSADTRREVTFEQALKIVQAAVREGAFAEAEEILASMLEVAPDHPDALHYWGLSQFLQGHVDKAIELLDRALAIMPDHPDLWNNIGNVRKQTMDFEGAAKAYRRAVELAPQSVYFKNNLISALRLTERYEEACALAEEALALAPDDINILNNASNLFVEVGNVKRAGECLGRILSHKTPTPKILEMQVTCFTWAGNLDQAALAVRKLVEIDPANATARHRLAALSGEDVPARASDDYIKQVFDDFSVRFDSNLKRLSYQAPELVAASLGRGAGEPGGDLVVLDAGCGTGLCGPLVRPYARHLTGMDLSAGMLVKARERGVYDALEQAELTAYMAARDSAYDAIVCADTFCYFGDLAPAMAAARGALRHGGLFVFTVEENVDTAEPHRIQQHGRYCHTEDYVRATCAAAGLTVAAIDRDTLRTEATKPVPGLIVRTAR